MEAILLGLRTREGLHRSRLSRDGLARAEAEAVQGRVVIDGDRVALTRTGRLFADAVALALS